jgi:hypothetical protein
MTGQRAANKFWIDVIETLRMPGQTDAQLAGQLGISKQFMSDVMAQKKELGLKLKMSVWKMTSMELTLDAALGFVPGKVADELRNVAAERVGSDDGARRVLSRDKHADWASDLQAMMKSQEVTAAALAVDLGVSGAYLSAVINRKTQASWGVKVEIWRRRGYDLSCETVLSFLPSEVVRELVDSEGAHQYTA